MSGHDDFLQKVFSSYNRVMAYYESAAYAGFADPPYKYDSVDFSRPTEVTDYYDFYWATLDLKTELMRCRSKFRSIGSCAPVIASVKSASDHLGQLRKLFGLNALALFPGDNALAQTFRNYIQASPTSYLRGMPTVMTQFAQDLKSMDEAIQSYDSLFSDEKLATIIDVLGEELRNETQYAWNYLDDPGRQTVELQRRLHLLLKRFTTRLLSLRYLLGNFLSEGLSVIRSAQEDKANRYLMMTTISTFFSAVTATILQMSYQSNGRSVQVATNALLLSSLVFSVSSAVSSLVAMAWHRSVVQPPEQILPRWVYAGLIKWPMVSLLTAGSLFSALNAAALTFLTLWLIVEEWKVRHLPDGAGYKLTESSLTLAIIDGLVRTVKFMCLGRSNFGGPSYSHAEAGQTVPWQARPPHVAVGPNTFTAFDIESSSIPTPSPVPAYPTPLSVPAFAQMPVFVSARPTVGPQTQHAHPVEPAYVAEYWPGGNYPLPGRNNIPGKTNWLRGPRQ